MIILLQIFIFTISCSQYTLTLSSGGKTKNIPILQTWSCQMSVFSVYDYLYHVNIQIESSNTMPILLISIPSQNVCSSVVLNQSTEVNLDVNRVNFGGQTQVTQQIYLKLTDKTEQCNNEGELRVIYLIDKNQQSQYNYGIYLPQDAVIFTQCLAFLVLILLCSNIKYRRISPFRFGFIFSFLYPTFLFSIVYVSSYVQSSVDITYYAVMLFSLVLMCVYFSDIASCCSDKPPIIYSTSTLAAVFVIVLDMFVLPQAWFINDFIAVVVSGTLIKFVVIKKMRTSIIPLGIFWVFFVIRQFAIDFRLQNFEQAMEIRISPLFLQLPTVFNDSLSGYPCSAFGTSKIVIMGLIVNYAIRVDLFLSGHFYTIIVSVTALISMFLQVLIAVFISQLPVIEYLGVIIFIPAAAILMMLSASKRGQWAQIWHGSFHDIAVDRKSVKRQSSELDQEQIIRNLQQLHMNPSLLSEN